MWLSLAFLFAWKSIAVTAPAQDVIPPAPLESPIASPSPSSSTVSASPTPSAVSASPSTAPVTVLPAQDISIYAPNKILVDPRAKSALLPQLNIGSTGALLVCLDSTQIGIHLAAPGAGGALVRGDGTSHIRISGTASEIFQVLNSDQGSRAFSSGPGIGNTTLSIRSVLLSEPSIDSAFCDAADSSNTRTLYFAPIDLALSITKASVRVK